MSATVDRLREAADVLDRLDGMPPVSVTVSPGFGGLVYGVDLLRTVSVEERRSGVRRLAEALALPQPHIVPVGHYSTGTQGRDSTAVSVFAPMEPVARWAS